MRRGSLIRKKVRKINPLLLNQGSRFYQRFSFTSREKEINKSVARFINNELDERSEKNSHRIQEVCNFAKKNLSSTSILSFQAKHFHGQFRQPATVVGSKRRSGTTSSDGKHKKIEVGNSRPTLLLPRISPSIRFVRSPLFLPFLSLRTHQIGVGPIPFLFPSLFFGPKRPSKAMAAPSCYRDGTLGLK